MNGRTVELTEEYPVRTKQVCSILDTIRREIRKWDGSEVSMRQQGS
jgi:hypothetical protein